MCPWIGKQGRFLDRHLLGFLNLQSHPLPSTLHLFDQQLSKQRATANNYFQCNYNQLTELPNSIGKLANLNFLNCSNYQLTQQPNSIGDLPNLTCTATAREGL